ncbi:sulfatase-like hydrolase/transferase [Verrucomicrobia bacterium]|nr:sulfatase-like hydrolase/transferase [Verrucomicrobiota bacterium]
MFVSDDMGWNEVGYHGSKIATPNIDRLAKDGIQLNRFYVHPICSPTRTALMTGRSPARFGITGAIGRGVVPLDEHFLPQTFQKAGYQTFMTGKWHLGERSDDYAPNARGFDYFFGFHGGGINYYTTNASRARGWFRNGQSVAPQGYSTDLLADEAIKLLKNRNKKKPIFLYLPFNAPHQPAQASERLLEKYRKLGFFGRRVGQAGAIEAMDAAIGRVLATIEAEGISKDTLVMFFCDNGSGGGRRESTALPGQLALRGGKGSVLEGGIRVPAVLRWPGVIRAGTKCNQLISVQDLFPTFAAAAGIKPANQKLFDGVNCWPAIRQNKPMKRPPVIVAGPFGDFAVLHDQWKLTWGQGQVSLYNVKDDPAESKDVILDHPEVAANLADNLAPFSKLNISNQERGARQGEGRRP